MQRDWLIRDFVDEQVIVFMQGLMRRKAGFMYVQICSNWRKGTKRRFEDLILRGDVFRLDIRRFKLCKFPPRDRAAIFAVVRPCLVTCHLVLLKSTTV